MLLCFCASIPLFQTHIREAVLIKKITGRRECPNCHRLYNLATLKTETMLLLPLLPKVHGKCDTCGHDLFQRADDTEVSVVYVLVCVRETEMKDRTCVCVREW